MFIIVNGEVKVHDDDYVVAHMNAGNYFGEMSLLDFGPRSMSVSATEDTELICINQESFYSIHRNQPAVFRKIIAGLAQRLRTQNQLLIEELKSREDELKREVEEQTKLYKEQKERAEQSEKFKQQFLANMSHEIRTPINAIMGMTDILLEKKPGEEQLKYLHAIQKSSDNLLVIINDILDLSKIEAGKMELEKTEFSIREVMDLVQQTLQHKAEEKGLMLKMDYDEKLPSVLIGDSTRLNQILMNLVGNAIKFTEKGSVSISVIVSEGKPDQSVSIAVIDSEEKEKHAVSGPDITINEPVKQSSDNEKTQSSDRIRITFKITDTGIGMSADQLERIFESFTQATGDTTRRFGGTGLGLSISRQLVEMQGGKIEVMSEVEKGSTFSFSIEYDISSSQSILKKESRVTGEMIEALKGIKILLAEDNEYNRIVATETLKLKIPDVEIEIAHNGEEVLEILRKEAKESDPEPIPSATSGANRKFEIILMDVQMPVMDGYETTKYIRSQIQNSGSELPRGNREIRNPNIPIIALTASVLRADIEKCFSVGMNGYVAKPFKSTDLILAIYDVVVKKSGAQITPNETARNEIPAPPGEKITDLTFLKNFCEGDESRMKKYIRMYLDAAPASLEKITEALEKKDYDTVKRTVHMMKAHLTYMGMNEARSLAEKIELHAATQINHEQLLFQVHELNNFCAQSFNELEEAIKTAS